MTIFVFGNPDLKMDALPILLIPSLKKALPQHDFRHYDPNEEWENNIFEPIIIDTVLGIKKITIFDSLEKFSVAPRVSLHGFDAYFNLRVLQKLRKIKKIKIIGIPPTISKKYALKKIISFLK